MQLNSSGRLDRSTDNTADLMRDHRDLIVWQKGMDLAADIYTVTANFPRSEQFGLTSQIRRSAVSIVSNIAEGSGRRTTRDFYAFIHIARGSLAELETQITLAHRIGLPVPLEHLTPRLNELGKLVNGLLRSLERRMSKSQP